MEQIGWTSIVLSVLTLLGGCGWLIDRKKHRQEIESLKADNRQKDMNRRTSERRGQAGLDYPEREGGNAKRNSGRRGMNAGLPAFVEAFHPKRSLALPSSDATRPSPSELGRHSLLRRFVVGTGGVSLEDFLGCEVETLL